MVNPLKATLSPADEGIAGAFADAEYDGTKAYIEQAQLEEHQAGRPWTEDEVQEALFDYLSEKWHDSEAARNYEDEEDSPEDLFFEVFDFASDLIMKRLKAEGVIFESMEFTPANRVRFSARIKAKVASSQVEAKTPPNISEGLMHKLKKQYPGNKEAAYATAWKISKQKAKASKVDAATAQADVEELLDMTYPNWRNMMDDPQVKKAIEEFTQMLDGFRKEAGVEAAKTSASKIDAASRDQFIPQAISAVDDVLDLTYPSLKDSTDPGLIEALSELNSVIARIAAAADKATGQVRNLKKPLMPAASKPIETFETFQASLKKRTGLTAEDAGIKDAAAWDAACQVIGSKRWIDGFIKAHHLNDLEAK